MTKHRHDFLDIMEDARRELEAAGLSINAKEWLDEEAAEDDEVPTMWPSAPRC